MIKIISFIVLLFLLYSCAALNPEQQNKPDPNDIVPWSDSVKISWDDFQGTPIKSAPYSSEIYIYIGAYFNKPMLFLPASSTVECYMSKKTSWVNRNMANAQGLFFNQTLFDIYELYARKLRKKLSETSLGIVDPAGVFKSIYQANNDELNKTIAQYRNETEMGSNLEKINLWSENTLKDIHELDDFKYQE